LEQDQLLVADSVEHLAAVMPRGQPAFLHEVNELARRSHDLKQRPDVPAFWVEEAHDKRFRFLLSDRAGGVGSRTPDHCFFLAPTFLRFLLRMRVPRREQLGDVTADRGREPSHSVGERRRSDDRVDLDALGADHPARRRRVPDKPRRRHAQVPALRDRPHHQPHTVVQHRHRSCRRRVRGHHHPRDEGARFLLTRRRCGVHIGRSRLVQPAQTSSSARGRSPLQPRSLRRGGDHCGLHGTPEGCRRSGDGAAASCSRSSAAPWSQRMPRCG